MDNPLSSPSVGIQEGAKNERSILGLFIVGITLAAASGQFDRFGVSSQIWLLIYASFVYLFAVNYANVKVALKESWFLLLLPSLVIASALWSEDQARTLVAAVQYFFTACIGIWIGANVKPRELFVVMLLATVVGVLLSLVAAYLYDFVNAYQMADFDGAERYLVGIYAQKNVFGKTLFLLTLSLLVLSFGSRWLLLVYPVTGLLLIPLLEVKSASSLICYLIILSLPLFWLAMRNKKIGFTLIFSLWIVFLAGLFAAVFADIDLVDQFLGGLGKDSTLTGRTYLWSVAIQSMDQHPVLGMGFEAFWQPDVYDSTKLLRNAEGNIITGFHNVFLETVVATGLLGGFFLMLIFLVSLYRCSLWFYKTQSAESLGSLYFVVVTLLLGFFDNVVFAQHELFHIILIALCVMSYKQIHRSRNNNNNNKESQ